MDKDCQNIRQEAIKISWFMRGGVSINDLMDRYSHEDLNILAEIIKENVENTKASQMALI